MRQQQWRKVQETLMSFPTPGKGSEAERRFFRQSFLTWNVTLLMSEGEKEIKLQNNSAIETLRIFFLNSQRNLKK